MFVDNRCSTCIRIADDKRADRFIVDEDWRGIAADGVEKACFAGCDSSHGLFEFGFGQALVGIQAEAISRRIANFNQKHVGHRMRRMGNRVSGLGISEYYGRAQVRGQNVAQLTVKFVEFFPARPNIGRRSVPDTTSTVRLQSPRA